MSITIHKYLKQVTLEGSTYGFIFIHKQDVTCNFSTYGLQHSRVKYNIDTTYEISFNKDVELENGKRLRSCDLITLDEQIEPEIEQFTGTETFDIYSLPLNLPKLSKENIKKTAIKVAMDEATKFLLPIEIELFSRQAIEALVYLNSNRLQKIPRG